MGSLRLNAYVLAADPAWIEASLLSYYDVVNRVVISYDRDGLGYTGVPVDVEQCVRRLKAVDAKGKFDFRPGVFCRREHTPMQNETHQRITAIGQAGTDADWVVQLDTDEVMCKPELFLECLGQADAAGFEAMEFPSHWIYSGIGGDRYLAICRRWGRIDASYPGAMAIKPGAPLNFARRPKGACYHVDVVAKRSYGETAVPVHRVIDLDEGILHMSMVRSIAEMHKKLATWSHSKDMDWSPEFETWMMAHAAPQYAAIASQLDMSSRRRHLWPVRLSAAACKLLDRSPVDIANIQANREKARGETGIMRGTWRSYLIPAIGRVTGAVKRRLPGKPRGEVAELQGVTDGK